MLGPNRNTYSRRRFLVTAALTTLAACTTTERSLVSPPVTAGEIDVGGSSLPYWDTGGAGVPLILMHPFAGSLESWPAQQAAFVGAGFRVIAYSRRGVGATQPISTPINHAEDLERVLEALGIQRAHLVTVAGGYGRQSAGLAPTAQTNEVTLEAIAATRVPILLIAGEYDPLLTPEMLQVIAARLPNAEPHLIRNAGHQAHWEQPEAFNALVLDFVRRHQTR
jgi:pimeloyl-ACP methyl ester carboxylesterase